MALQKESEESDSDKKPVQKNTLSASFTVNLPPKGDSGKFGARAMSTDTLNKLNDLGNSAKDAKVKNKLCFLFFYLNIVLSFNLLKNQTLKNFNNSRNFGIC